MVGLRHLLQEVLPLMQVTLFYDVNSLLAEGAELFFHYFVSEDILEQELEFFTQNRHKTIVLTRSVSTDGQLERFRCISVNQPEKQLVKSLLTMEQKAHSHGRNLPPSLLPSTEGILSPREIEVLSLVVKGLINKEIAECLHICLSTVITHRKNITEKLGTKSVSALTIYAVTHGYVDIHDI
ncbi:MAG: LuxR C-terminal-related transcriptional regulator [Prevotella sp.]|nr:LuxR C-terminal-related transcriptional regulator [Prevotella sp.]